MASTVRIPFRRTLVDAQLVVDGRAIQHDAAWSGTNEPEEPVPDEEEAFVAVEPAPVLSEPEPEPEDEAWDAPPGDEAVPAFHSSELQAELSEKIDELQETLQNLAAQVAQRSSENEGLEQRVAELMAKLERQQQEHEEALATQTAERTEEHTQFQRVVQALDDVVEPVHQELSAAARELRQSVPQLSVAIASRLLHERIEANDYPIESVVSNLVSRFESGEPIVVSFASG